MYSLLIVDDEPIILSGMQKKIDWQAYGFTNIAVESTYSGACEAATLLRPSLCLIDVCIGKEKGYDLIEDLKSLGVKSHYVMMSGYDEFEYARNAIRCGALDYLLKPVDSDMLSRVVEKIVVEHLGWTISSSIKRKVDSVLLKPYDDFSPLIQKVFMIVRLEYRQTLNLKVLGEKFRMNAAYLGQLFQQSTRIKFSEYLMVFRLEKAKELLIHTNDKVAAVASSVGYDNMSYFYTQFKSYFGQSPTDIRNNA